MGRLPPTSPAALPASVATTPPGTVLVRRRSAPASVMSARAGAPGTGVQPLTVVKDAAAPVPSAVPTAALPARVDTAPLGVTSRMRPVESATQMLPEGKTPKPKVEVKEALEPAPSAPPAAAPPASGEAVHTSPRGSAAVPLLAHADGQVQGAGGASPPRQKEPGAHGAPSGDVEPAAQPLPGGATQGPLQAALTSPDALPKRPAGQGRNAPPLPYAPGGGSASVSLRSALAL
jgi:hypothetical protein